MVTLGGAVIPRWLQPLLARSGELREASLGRVLVVVNMGGGNDGLNTLVPYTNDIYYNFRPNIAIPPNQVLTINNELGFHPVLDLLMNQWNEGQMAIVQDVGYPDQNLSHFRSTDIWRSASDAEAHVDTGWVARYLETVYTDYIENPPEFPMALQQGSSDDLLLRGTEGVTGLIVDDPNTFAELVGSTYEGEYENDPPNTAGGAELSYVRQIDLNAFTYAQVIQDAAEAGSNTLEYPNTNLGFQLGSVARLLSGGMYTPVFLVHQYGYDTHANQQADHVPLLSDLAESLGTFHNDIKNMGLEEYVITLTTSEFGRRPFENGSLGTDHGAAAPLFLIGQDVNGGIYGNNTDLENFDEDNNILHQYDFRQIYSTVLEDWFSMSPDGSENVLFQPFATLPLINNPTTSINENGSPLPVDYSLGTPYPNPFNAVTKLKYSVKEKSPVDISVFDALGRKVANPVRGLRNAGIYELSLTAKNWSSGAYLVRMTAGRFTATRKINLVK